MKIGAPFIPPSLAAAGGDSLVLRGDPLLLEKLTLGQIIKGRVLRSYEGQRYLMHFEGQERIVDSAVPLRTGDILHGRVIGLGERIELQRVAVQPDDAPSQDDAAEPARPRADLADPSLRFVADLFARHHERLAPDDARALQRQAGRAALPELMALSGLVLSKLNLRMAPEFLKAIYDALERGARGRVFAPGGTALAIEMAGTHDAESREPLASLLAQVLMDVPESRRPDNAPADVKPDDSALGKPPSNVQGANAGLAPDSGRARSGEGFDLARWILNAQNGGAVAHRVGTLPLLIGGRLVELDVALFEEHGGDSEQETSSMRHRRLVVGMDTETLGRIEASALFAADHIRVTFSTASSESTGALARRMGPLTAELEHFGWHVDEMKYETRVPVVPGAVLKSVVEHLVSPGSVSTLA